MVSVCTNTHITKNNGIKMMKIYLFILIFVIMWLKITAKYMPDVYPVPEFSDNFHFVGVERIRSGQNFVIVETPEPWKIFGEQFETVRKVQSQGYDRYVMEVYLHEDTPVWNLAKSGTVLMEWEDGKNHDAVIALDGIVPETIFDTRKIKYTITYFDKNPINYGMANQPISNILESQSLLRDGRYDWATQLHRLALYGPLIPGTDWQTAYQTLNSIRNIGLSSWQYAFFSVLDPKSLSKTDKAGENQNGNFSTRISRYAKHKIKHFRAYVKEYDKNILERYLDGCYGISGSYIKLFDRTTGGSYTAIEPPDYTVSIPNLAIDLYQIDVYLKYETENIYPYKS